MHLRYPEEGGIDVHWKLEISGLLIGISFLSSSDF